MFYHESWQNDICSFRAMTVALTVSFKLISFIHLYCVITSGVGVRLKVGVNIDKSEGWGLGRGCVLPSWGLRACPQKINQVCAKNYAILSKFCYFFPILQHKNLPAHQKKWGGLSPVLKVGDLSPCSPCSDGYGNNACNKWIIIC